MSRAIVSTGHGWLATALLTSFVAAIIVGVGRPVSTAVAVSLTALMVGAGVAAVGVLRGRGAALLLGMTAAIGLGLTRGAMAAERDAASIGAHLTRAPVTVVGTVRESVAQPSAHRLVVEAGRLIGADTEMEVTGGLLIPATPAMAAQVEPGDAVAVATRGLRPPGRRPGARSADALERLGVAAVAVSARLSPIAPRGRDPLHLLTAIRTGLTAAVDAQLPEPAATLLLGIALGIRRPLDHDLTSALQDAGLFHIVVVSGLKVVIVAGMVHALARVRGWPRRRHLLVAVIAVGGYVLLSGAGPAAVRSAAMAALALLSRREGRRADPGPVLALVAAVMLAADPHLWSDVGFQLSFLGTAGILLLAGRLAGHLPGPRALVEPFAVTVAAEIATLPVMAGTFGVVSLVGPAANAAVLPLLPVLIVLGGAGAVCSAALPPLGWVPLHAAAGGVHGIVLIASLAASLPVAAIHIGDWPPAWTLAEVAAVAGAGVVIVPSWIRHHRLGEASEGSVSADGADVVATRAAAGPRRGTNRRGIQLAAAAMSGALSAATVLIITGRPDGRLHLSVLDVGAASAVLVTTPDGSLTLVDGGADPAALLTALGRILPPPARTLDLVVLTGGGRTEAAGLAGLAGHYGVRRVAAPDGLPGGARTVMDGLLQAGAAVMPLGDRPWTWGGAGWRCLRLGDRTAGGPECLLTVVARPGRALILGGATAADQEEAAGLFGTAMSADVVVTPGGGAVAPALLTVARPRWVAMPTAPVARTPAGDVVARSARTGVDGDLTFTATRGALRRDGEDAAGGSR